MSRETPLDPAALGRLPGRRVLVVGDVIVDRYLHGRVERISPEAPVPVVRLEGEELRPGGAANVAVNLRALGVEVDLVAVVGRDGGAERLGGLLRDAGVDPSGLLPVTGRPTTVKSRVLARHQQVLRLDEEDDHPVPDDVARALVDRAVELLGRAEALVVSDYAKGLLDGRSLPVLLGEAAARGVPVVIDPKIRHFELYSPATVITPNQAELARATAREIRSPGEVAAAAREVHGRLRLAAVLVTRGEEGMLLVPREGEPLEIPALAREVYDVTGAGDTVTAVLAAGLAAGFDLPQAARWANLAAAVAVGRLGTAAVSREELARFLAGSDGEEVGG